MSVLLWQKHSIWSLVLNIQDVASWREFNLFNAARRSENSVYHVVLATDAGYSASCDILIFIGKLENAIAQSKHYHHWSNAEHFLWVLSTMLWTVWEGIKEILCITTDGLWHFADYVFSAIRAVPWHITLSPQLPSKNLIKDLCGRQSVKAARILKAYLDPIFCM